jgi:hypothetical protein
LRWFLPNCFFQPTYKKCHGLQRVQKGATSKQHDGDAAAEPIENLT